MNAIPFSYSKNYRNLILQAKNYAEKKPDKAVFLHELFTPDVLSQVCFSKEKDNADGYFILSFFVYLFEEMKLFEKNAGKYATPHGNFWAHAIMRSDFRAFHGCSVKGVINSDLTQGKLF